MESRKIQEHISKNKDSVQVQPIWKRVVNTVLFIPRLPFLAAIRLYQMTLSPDHGLIKGLYPHGYCRFYPSCSEYGFQVIYKYGLIIGIPKTIWRVVRCNPWNEGGEDLP